MRRHTRTLCLWILTLASALPAALPTVALTVHGDADWRGSASCPNEWADPSLDDSTWSRVVYPWTFMTPHSPPDLLEARPFWTDAEDGITCVRRHFTLPQVPQQPAHVRIWVDDDYELYINGALVGASHDQSHPLPGETYDVSPLLRNGDNVVALKLIDWGGERGALFSLNVPDVPEASLTFTGIVPSILPWLIVLALGAAITLALLTANALRGSTWIRHLPPGVAAAAAIVTVIACQWLLQSGELYSVPIPYRGHPWAEWDWRQCALIAGLLTLMVAVTGGDPEPAEARKALHRTWVWLLAILALGLFLRTAALDSVPMGFVQDEAINGNESLTLLDGRPLSLWSDSIGGRPTLFLYVLGASLRVFGRSYLSLKIVPVACGLASVVAVYACGRVALGPRAALWAAFLLTISWWHNHFSRLALEACCVPFFSAAGFALLLHGLGRCRHPVLSIVAGSALLATGVYTYAAYRAVPVAAGLFLIATALSRDRGVLRERALPLLAAGLVSAAILVPLVNFAWHNPALYWRRYDDVSITPQLLYYATPLPWLHQFAKGLLALNQRGYEYGSYVPTYLDAVTGALFLLGLVSRPSEQQRRGVRLLWVWFLTFAALASLTIDSPQLTRQLGLLPPIVLFAGFGATHLVAYLYAALQRRPLVWAGAASVAVGATLLNVYLYFISWQNIPYMDARMNTLARTLCETVRQSGPVHFYWTPDLEYWAQQQCAFVLPGGYAALHLVRLEEVLDTHALRRVDGPVLLALGAEFLTHHYDQIPHDANGEPHLDVPVRPQVKLDRQARPMYYLYRF